MSLGLKQHSVARFLIDFNLGMIRTHVTLCTRAGVPCVTDGTVSDRAVSVRPSHTMALLTPTGFRRRSFQLRQWISGATGTSRLIGLRKIHLLGGEPLLAMDRSPRGRCVAAAQELLINALVAAAAVTRCQLAGDYETVVIPLLLPRRWLVAVQAIHALSRVHAHLILVHYRVLGSRVTFCALSGGPDQVRSRFLRLHFRPGAVDQQCRQDKRERQNHSEKERAKRHAKPPRGRLVRIIFTVSR